MSNTHQHAPIRRILLALDTTTHSLAAVEATTALAARLDAALHALFVEDINLLRLAALPFARETRLTSATTHRLQNQDMEPPPPGGRFTPRETALGPPCMSRAASERGSTPRRAASSTPSTAT